MLKDMFEPGVSNFCVKGDFLIEKHREDDLQALSSLSPTNRSDILAHVRLTSILLQRETRTVYAHRYGSGHLIPTL